MADKSASTLQNTEVAAGVPYHHPYCGVIDYPDGTRFVPLKDRTSTLYAPGSKPLGVEEKRHD